MGGKGEFQEVLQAMKPTSELFPVPFPRFDEIREALDLDAADGGLDVERFDVIPEVGIDVFVVVSLREFAELPHEAFAAGIVYAGWAPAIAAPIPE